MFIPFVVFPLIAAAAMQALLFIKAQNPVIRFSPVIAGTIGLTFCGYVYFILGNSMRFSQSVVAENRYFAKSLALPFSCVIVGAAAAIGYILIIRMIEKEDRKQGCEG